jgi:hypothetical protein
MPGSAPEILKLRDVLLKNLLDVARVDVHEWLNNFTHASKQDRKALLRHLRNTQPINPPLFLARTNAPKVVAFLEKSNREKALTFAVKRDLVQQRVSDISELSVRCYQQLVEASKALPSAENKEKFLTALNKPFMQFQADLSIMVCRDLISHDNVLARLACVQHWLETANDLYLKNDMNASMGVIDGLIKADLSLTLEHLDTQHQEMYDTLYNARVQQDMKGRLKSESPGIPSSCTIARVLDRGGSSVAVVTGLIQNGADYTGREPRDLTALENELANPRQAITAYTEQNHEYLLQVQYQYAKGDYQLKSRKKFETEGITVEDKSGNPLMLKYASELNNDSDFETFYQTHKQMVDSALQKDWLAVSGQQHIDVTETGPESFRAYQEAHALAKTKEIAPGVELREQFTAQVTDDVIFKDNIEAINRAYQSSKVEKTAEAEGILIARRRSQLGETHSADAQTKKALHKCLAKFKAHYTPRRSRITTTVEESDDSRELQRGAGRERSDSAPLSGQLGSKKSPRAHTNGGRRAYRTRLGALTKKFNFSKNRSLPGQPGPRS